MKKVCMTMALAALSALAEELPPDTVVFGKWEMAQATAPGKWMPAVVPGTVLTTLVKNGLVPDPYYGLNNRRENRLIPDLSENREFYTATYRSKVWIPESFGGGRHVFMRPEGINYRGEIKLNGKLAQVTQGMFSRNETDVTRLVKTGAWNDIEVLVKPVDHPGDPKQKLQATAAGEWANGGDGEIGRDVTMLMCAGWDFTFSDGIRDRNTGIWRDIVFYSTGDMKLGDPQVITKLSPDLKTATVELSVDVKCDLEFGWMFMGCVSVDIPEVGFHRMSQKYLVRGNNERLVWTAEIDNPKLWWPRNKGPQNLHTAIFTIMDIDDEKIVKDQVKVRFGIREFASDQGGKDGARRFLVNGRPVFIRGTNWIPEAMLKADDERMRRELRLTAESGVNMVRLWAGGITESDLFYQLCDEYGLLVWQEFWLTGDTRRPEDEGLYLSCLRQQVLRLRNHASINHWVAANESVEVPGTRELIAQLDPTRSYLPGSEVEGVHDGSPYYPVNPMSYYEDTASPRGRRVYGFSPEYGTCALPAADQCRKFMPENLLWPMDVAAWKYREGGGFDRMTEYHHAAVNGYGESKTFDEYARKSQAADALGHQALWETWNLVRNEATGVLFWYNNTPIPQLGSHAWDYDLDQTASFFAQKNALEPLHAQYEYLSNRVSIVSDVYGTHELTVRAEVYDFDSRKVWEQEAKVKTEGEGCWDAFTIPFSTSTSSLHLSAPHFIKLRLIEKGREIASTFYWRSSSKYEGPETATGPCVAGFEKLSELPRTTLKFERTAGGVRVTNTGDKIAFMVSVQCFGKDGKRVVPVHYSDNFFALLPGESRHVTIEDCPVDAEIRVSAWND